MSYSLDQLFRLAENISITNIEDESVLLDLNSGSYYGLNHVGTLLLNELQQAHSLGQAIEAVSQRYQTHNRLVADDAHKLVNQLVTQNILLETE